MDDAMVRRVTALSALLLLTGGCAGTMRLRADAEGPSSLVAPRAESAADTAVASLPRAPADGTRAPYTIGPLDQLTILVVSRPDLGSQLPLAGSGERRISTVGSDGSVTLPLLGRFAVAGLTPAQVRAAVQKQYTLLVTGPQVEVEMFAFRSQGVEVQGEVEHPGRVFLSEATLTLGEVLAAAGGVGGGADTRHALLVRSGRTYRLDLYDALRGRSDVNRILLRSDDKLFVPPLKDRVVYVFGEVSRQGSFAIPDRGLSVLDALAQAEGTNSSSADNHRLYLVRGQGRDSSVFHLSLSQLVGGPEVPMAPGDRLYVPPTRITSWSRTLTQVVPFVYVITTGYLLARDISRR